MTQKELDHAMMQEDDGKKSFDELLNAALRKIGAIPLSEFISKENEKRLKLKS